MLCNLSGMMVMLFASEGRDIVGNYNYNSEIWSFQYWEQYLSLLLVVYRSVTPALISRSGSGKLLSPSKPSSNVSEQSPIPSELP